MVAAVEVRRIVDGGEVDELRRRAPREGFPEHAVAPRGYPALAACDGQKDAAGLGVGGRGLEERVPAPRASRRAPTDAGCARIVVDPAECNLPRFAERPLDRAHLA